MLRETINDRLDALQTEVKQLKYENKADNDSVMKLILAENTIKELNKILGKSVDRLRKKRGSY